MHTEAATVKTGTESRGAAGSPVSNFFATQNMFGSGGGDMESIPEEKFVYQSFRRNV